MNIRLVSRYLSRLSWILAASMIPSALWAPVYGEWFAFAAFAGSMAAAAAVGAMLDWAGRDAPDRLFQREALALVAFGWLLAAVIGAFPFVFAGVLHPVDAFFESMSGFTTTGSTVLADIEAVDRSILFWRSFTHWLGGMGIVVLFLAVLPYLGAGGKMLYRSESATPDARGMTPRIRDTAFILLRVYLFLTVSQTVLLMLAHMNLFDALCHTFGTLGTGGFSPRNDSVAAFHSLSVDIIIIVYMVLAGTNFALLFALRQGDFRALFRDTEWRVYVLILAGSTLLIALNLIGFQGIALVPDRPAPLHYSFVHALRVAAFQVSSIMTSTGFCTDNFELWPHFSRMLLILLMFVGGCAGSTSGGMKVVRVVMLFKTMYWRLERTFRPKTTRLVRINGEPVDADVQQSVLTFFALYIVVFVAATLFMSLEGLPFQTAASSVAATLNGVGPGLEHVGAIENFGFIPPMGKVCLSLCMVMGRLELYSICVLFLPGFWLRG